MADIKNFETLLTEFGKVLSTNLLPNEILRTLVEVDDQASKVLKSFGASREYSLAIKDNLAGATAQVKALGGEMSDVAKIQMDVADALGRNFITTKDSIAQLYAAQQVTGVNTERMINSFKNAGISALNAGDNMQKVVNTATQLGVNVGKTSAMVVDNMSMLNKYNFQGGVDGLAKMAAQAVNMRIDIKDMATMMDKAFEPESAIEMAAALQRLGVVQSDLLDPLRLLDLSQNDPTELQNQVAEMTKSFVRMGEAGNFEIAPGGKRQLMEISKAMGVSYDTLTKMALSSFELEDKMKKIQFPKDIASEEDKKFIANLSEAKGGEYKVSVFDKTRGEQVEKSVSELSKEDIDELRKMAQPKTMEELAKDQLSYLDSITTSVLSIQDMVGLGLSRSKTGEEILSTPAKYAKIIDEFAKDNKTNSEAIKNMITEQRGSVDKLVQEAKTKGLTSEEFKKTLGEIYESGKKTLSEGGKEMKDKLEAGLEKQNKDENIYSNLGYLLKSTLQNNLTPTTQGKDVIKLPGQNVQLLPEDGIMAGTGLEELVNFLKNPMQNGMPSDMSSASPKDVNVNVNFNGQNMPSNIDTNQLVLSVKNDQTLRQAIVEAVQSTMANNNLTPKGSLPPQGSMFSGYK